jgi:hypothetical protein
VLWCPARDLDLRGWKKDLEKLSNSLAGRSDFDDLIACPTVNADNYYLMKEAALPSLCDHYWF